MNDDYEMGYDDGYQRGEERMKSTLQEAFEDVIEALIDKDYDHAAVLANRYKLYRPKLLTGNDFK
jgi:phosphate uptake regulator